MVSSRSKKYVVSLGVYRSWRECLVLAACRNCHLNWILEADFTKSDITDTYQQNQKKKFNRGIESSSELVGFDFLKKSCMNKRVVVQYIIWRCRAYVCFRPIPITPLHGINFCTTHTEKMWIHPGVVRPVPNNVEDVRNSIWKSWTTNDKFWEKNVSQIFQKIHLDKKRPQRWSGKAGNKNYVHKMITRKLNIIGVNLESNTSHPPFHPSWIHFF